jgi:aubergine
MEQAKLLYTMVNTRVKTKFVANQGGRLSNPPPGTVLDHSVTKDNSYEFYMIPTSCRQGVPTPVHYTILHDSTGADPKDVQSMMYKLSHMYYNYNGPVKIPAPMKYSTRLASTLAENGTPTPHAHFDTIKGLYYI